ncbi:MAG: SGNH/GDSL hydrolase family protein [Bacteroidales bacterium]|nr:SGNH/GDSL hydrolase family protein [Bacteroidales bacterium]
MRILLVLLISLFVISVAEISLRVFGLTTYLIPEKKVYSGFSNSIMLDKTYGFALRDGTFKITINNGLRYTTTHKNGLRITNYTEIEDSNKSTIEFYGCSFTYGHGIDDSLTFPFLVQKELTNYNIKNYAVPGYGTIQALIKLREKHNKNDFPDIVILCYADFHHERDQLLESWQEKYTINLEQSEIIFNNESLKTSTFPYAEIKNDTLLIKYRRLQEFARVGFMRKYSVLCNQLCILFQKKPCPTVTFAIINQINELCLKNNSRLIVATLTIDPAIYGYCSTNNIELWDIFVPWYENGLNLLPYDPHPNSEANRRYAELIISYFEEN